MVKKIVVLMLMLMVVVILVAGCRSEEDSQVPKVGDDSQVTEVGDDSQVPEVGDDSNVAEVEDDSQVTEVGDDSQVSEVEEESQAAEVGGEVKLPERGICAHRGASGTHPENTLSAFREAIRLGAHMIEFDIAMTKDGKLALMHDATIDRTTNGKGKVSDFTLAELKGLDAGSWKGSEFANERIPTLDEALAIMPVNVWLNVHLKGGAEMAEKVAERIVATGRLHQAFLACGKDAAHAAKQVEPNIQICNMERPAKLQDYINETIGMKAEFIQLLTNNAVEPGHTKLLKENGVRINYYYGDEADKVVSLFETGVDFPLANRVGEMLKVAEEEGIERLKPIYRSK
ncbi:MAG: hypothetical protein JXD22_01510 [Sedimentisphaerales bacterium]|nr:hypothetical protein [Sedimentisphaerales bacterium]